MNFEKREEQDGLRFSWNYWPTTKIGATRNVIPIGAMYTPFKGIETMQTVNYKPVECNNCKSVLNPHCKLDIKNKLWICPICNINNKFLPHYANHISETSLPFELMDQNTTIEYELPETSH